MPLRRQSGFHIPIFTDRVVAKYRRPSCFYVLVCIDPPQGYGGRASVDVTLSGLLDSLSEAQRSYCVRCGLLYTLAKVRSPVCYPHSCSRKLSGWKVKYGHGNQCDSCVSQCCLSGTNAGRKRLIIFRLKRYKHDPAVLVKPLIPRHI